MTLVRNETQRHSAALKIAGQNPIGLLPLDGFSFTVPTFQLSSVFDAVSNRLFIIEGVVGGVGRVVAG